MPPRIRKGQAPPTLERAEFHDRFMQPYQDPAFHGVLVHGDVAGVESLRHALCDWLDWMGLIDAGVQARLDLYIGYYQPYATSHDALDDDVDVQEETRNVARAVAAAVGQLRAGKLSVPDRALSRPRPK